MSVIRCPLPTAPEDLQLVTVVTQTSLIIELDNLVKNSALFCRTLTQLRLQLSPISADRVVLLSRGDDNVFIRLLNTELHGDCLAMFLR